VALALAEQGVSLVLSYRRSKDQAEETRPPRGFGRRGARGPGRRLRSRERPSGGRARATGVPPDRHPGQSGLVYQPVGIDEVREREWRDNIGSHILGTFWPSQLIAP